VRALRQLLFDGPVIEIGSGHRPYPQSHVLVDKYLEPEQREGPLATDGRPVVVAGIEDLPFRDGAFAFSICSHVVEHAKDIGAALDELQRVSRAGYIETPSALFEIVEPHRRYHRWVLMEEAGRLRIRPKSQEIPFEQSVLRALTNGNFGFKLFNATNPQLRATAISWRDRIEYQVEEGEFHPDDYLARCAQGRLGFARAATSRLGAKLDRAFAARAARLRRRYPLEPLLRCARCHGQVRIEATQVVCDTCRGHYPRRGELYFLSAEAFTVS